MQEDELVGDGWDQSAEAWVRRVDSGDPSRVLLLDEAMLRALGDVGGKRVCDIGCGEGRFCRKLRGLGAETLGLDPTDALIRLAKGRDDAGSYLRARAEAVPVQAESFDVAVSYVALVDVPDLTGAVKEMARILRPGGRIVASILSPMVTANDSGWIKDEAGKPLHRLLSHYMEERADVVAWAGIRVVNYHRPLSMFLNAFLSLGLVLEAFEEPLLSEEALHARPDLAPHNDVPLFQVWTWLKGPVC